jgi:hypothetical protein
LACKEQEVTAEMKEKTYLCSVSKTKEKGMGIMSYNNYISVYSGVLKEKRGKGRGKNARPQKA